MLCNSFCLSSVRRKVVIVLHSATPIKFPQTNYLTFGDLLSRNAGDFLGVGQCRGRFLRVFERLAIICVSSICKINADLGVISLDLSKIIWRFFEKRRRLSELNSSSFVC